MTNARLNRLCDEAIGRLERAIDLIRDVKKQDGASDNASRWLLGLTRAMPFEGRVLCLSLDSVFEELREIEVDEVFGPRESLRGEPETPDEVLMEQADAFDREPLYDSLHPEGL